MNKPLIGVISYRYIEEDRPFKTYTYFNSYLTDKLSNLGCNVYGIIFPNGEFDSELMSMFDGFVFQGGSLIELCQIRALAYAYENNIPTIGICNGMQTMVGYEYLKNKFKSVFTKEVDDFYKKIGEECFLEKVDNHNIENPFFLKNKNNAKHNINIVKGSILYDLFKKDKMSVISVHNSKCKEGIINKYFKVTSRSDDNTIESIERVDNNFMLGVQYHIELDNENDLIFNKFYNEVIKYHRNR